jgi:hypothetical protein
MTYRRKARARRSKSCWKESSALLPTAQLALSSWQAPLPQPRHLIPPDSLPEEAGRRKPSGKLALLIVLGFLLLISLPALIPNSGPKPEAKRTKFLSQMKGVFPALRMYADDHDGKFPALLTDLEPNYLAEGSLARLTFKDNTSGKFVEPVYFPGYTASTPPGTILLGSTLSGGRYRVVVYADGSATVPLDAKYQELLKQQPPREW